MTRRMILTALVGAACFASVGTAQAVTLVTPQGTPIGNPWQAWADDSYAPTYPGVQTLDISSADAERYCTWVGTVVAYPACTTNYGITQGSAYGIPETIISANDPEAQADLLYEEGHVMDDRLATDADRSEFMTFWGLQGGVATWWNGESNVGTDVTATPGEWWSEGYQLCAMNAGWSRKIAITRPQVWRSDYPALDLIASLNVSIENWATDTQLETCRLIASLVPQTPPHALRPKQQPKALSLG